MSDAIRLTHPDHHPPERQALAHRDTQELLKLQPFVFSAPKLNVAKAPPQTGPCYESTSGPAASAKEPSRPSYPCKDCADTIPLHYCDACSAEWDRRRQKEHDRETSSQRAWYARRRKRALAKRPAKHCASCGKQFDPKRADAQFCSARCRQRTHRGAAITDKSKPSAQPLFIRDAQRLILTALKHHPAVFLNDILPPERTNAQYQALFRASRLLEDAGEIGSKSYYFRFMKPGFLALVRPRFKPKHPDKIVRLTPDQRQAIAGEQP